MKWARFCGAQALAQEVACYLGLDLSHIKIKRFADGEIYVQVQVRAQLTLSLSGMLVAGASRGGLQCAGWFLAQWFKQQGQVGKLPDKVHCDMFERGCLLSKQPGESTCSDWAMQGVAGLQAVSAKAIWFLVSQPATVVNFLQWRCWRLSRIRI